MSRRIFHLKLYFIIPRRRKRVAWVCLGCISSSSKIPRIATIGTCGNRTKIYFEWSLSIQRIRGNLYRVFSLGSIWKITQRRSRCGSISTLISDGDHDTPISY